MENGILITRYIHSIEKDPMTYIERNVVPERYEKLNDFIAAHNLTGKARRLDVYEGQRIQTKEPLIHISIEFEGLEDVLNVQIKPEEMKGNIT